MFLLVFQPNQSEFAVELRTLVRHTIRQNNTFTFMNIYRIIWLTGKVLYELLLGIIDWKSWLLFEQTDRYKLLKNSFKISKDFPASDLRTCQSNWIKPYTPGLFSSGTPISGPLLQEKSETFLSAVGRGVDRSRKLQSINRLVRQR